MIEIKNTKDNTKPSLVLCVYGTDGIGKSTMASTAPKPIFFDAENGTKAFGIRGIYVPVVNVKTFAEVREAWTTIKDDSNYETIVIDPVDAFMKLLIEEVSRGGSMSLPKWGEAKSTFYKFIHNVKNSGKHIIFVAHDAPETNDNKIFHSPKLSVNLAGELTAACDIVGYLSIQKDGTRRMFTQPSEDFKAKDRYDVFTNGIIEDLNVTTMIETIHAAYNKEPFEEKVQS